MDYNTYVSCISDAGYNPSSTGNGNTNDNGYYAIGFGPGVLGSGEFPACRTTNTQGVNWFAAGKGTGGAIASTQAYLTTGSSQPSIARDSFTAVAAGVIEANKTAAADGNLGCDKWTMNQQKILRNVRVGY